ncbi:TRAP transporter substrate-binding protein [Actinotalea sp. Marseille-Q4924]|uniref:TRAP transporter substrate-binding protein n=1 Tax=Actinotalea sp. Marseille-Q4924 TaxID=2866571 RepID=UPI001CE4A597|nr:TRAP transporter substrate-binding protein DctP [Actinotalea sp. Marseille-Q4924]
MPGGASRSLGPVVVGLATTLLAAGCGAPGGISQAGFAAPSVRLTLGVADPPGFYSWTLAEEFARRVASETDGAIEIEVTQGDEIRGWNQALARRAVDGDLDLTLLPAQTWDVLDVPSLTALYVPFLVRDEEHLDALATGDVADELLAGLDGSGVTGLGLLPGGMRHFFADGAPPVVPDDLDGVGVRSALSTTVWSMIEAFGGSPDDPNGAEVGEELRAGRVTVLDSMFALADGPLGAPAAAGDVAPYPLAFTLVVNDGRLQRLPVGHRQALRDAAVDTTAWAASTRPSEAQEAQELCERAPRAKVVLAGPDAVRSWKDAAADVVGGLRADPAVDALAERIDALADRTEPAPAVRPCHGAEVDADGDAGSSTDGQSANIPVDFPEGVYRKEITAEELIDVGVTAADAHAHAGVWMMVIRDGRYGPEDDQECPGSTYDVVDGRIVVTLGPEGPGCGEAAGQVLYSAGWRLDGDQLMLTDVRSGHGSDLLITGIFGSTAWTRLE